MSILMKLEVGFIKKYDFFLDLRKKLYKLIKNSHTCININFDLLCIVMYQN